MTHRPRSLWRYGCIGGGIGGAIGLAIMILSFVTGNAIAMVFFAYPLFWGLMSSMERNPHPGLTILAGLGVTLVLYIAIGAILTMLTVTVRRILAS